MTDVYDPLQFNLRSGKDDDPYLQKNELLKIVNNMIIFSELPDKKSHVQIKGYYETYKDPINSNNFLIDYSLGRAYFNPSENGKTVFVSYMGKGIALLSADRVYLHNENQDILQTLQDVVDGQSVAVEATANLNQIKNGFMQKELYDTNNSGIVDNAENALNSQKLENNSLADLDDRYPSSTAFNSHLAESVNLSLYAKIVPEVDDTARTQRAINDAISKNLPLVFPVKEHSYSNKLIVTNAIDLVIVSQGATLTWPSTLSSLFTFENCDNVIISGLNFESDGTGGVVNTNGSSAITFNKKSANIRVEKCKFKGCTNASIRVMTQGTDSTALYPTDVTRSNVIIIDNIFTLCESAFNTKYGGARNIVLANNIVYKCSGGFKIDGETASSFSPLQWQDYPTLTGNAVITGNVFSELDTLDYTTTSWGVAAVALEENVENVLISNNIMTDFRLVNGVQMSGGQGNRDFKNVSIVNNKMINFNSSHGVSIVRADGYDIEDITIEGNTFNKFNASVIRVQTTQGIKDFTIKNNQFRDVCQNTPYLHGEPPYPAINIESTAANTYYAQCLFITDNSFKIHDSTKFNEYKEYLYLFGFIVEQHDHVVIARNSFIRPHTENVSTEGIKVYDVSKCIVKDNYFEEGRSYLKHTNAICLGNREYWHRWSLGGGSTIPTPVRFENCEFISNTNTPHLEDIKADNSTTVTVKNNNNTTGFVLGLYNGSTLVESSRTITKTSAPTINAQFIGQVCIDTVAKKVYNAVSTGSGASDWVVLN